MGGEPLPSAPSAPPFHPRVPSASPCVSHSPLLPRHLGPLVPPPPVPYPLLLAPLLRVPLSPPPLTSSPCPPSPSPPTSPGAVPVAPPRTFGAPQPPHSLRGSARAQLSLMAPMFGSDRLSAASGRRHCADPAGKRFRVRGAGPEAANPSAGRGWRGDSL